MNNNNLLEEINKKKKNMNHVNDTIVTSVDGKKYKVNLNNNNNNNNNSSMSSNNIGELISNDERDKSYGFIVDTKPDDKVYQVIIPIDWHNSNSCNNNSICKLYIGSQDAALNLKELKMNDIKSILNVGYGIPNHFENNINDDDDNVKDKISYLKIDMLDDVTYNIIDQFNRCFEFIDSQPSVLIHCNAGISRSSTILLAYMMNKYKKPLSTCLTLVRDARACVKPNQGFQKQLEQFEKILKIV